MREFSRNITAVHYQAKSQDQFQSQSQNVAPIQSQGHRAGKLSKNEWQLVEVKAGESVQVDYAEVYCYDLSVRTAYVDQTRLYGNSRRWR